MTTKPKQEQTQEQNKQETKQQTKQQNEQQKQVNFATSIALLTKQNKISVRDAHNEMKRLAPNYAKTFWNTLWGIK